MTNTASLSFNKKLPYSLGTRMIIALSCLSWSIKWVISNFPIFMYYCGGFSLLNLCFLVKEKSSQEYIVLKPRKTMLPAPNETPYLGFSIEKSFSNKFLSTCTLFLKIGKCKEKINIIRNYFLMSYLPSDIFCT